MGDTARNISMLRGLAGMTQKELATVAGVSRSSVTQWERGYSEPRMGAVQRLADHFGIPKSWIVDRGGMDGVRVVSGALVKPGADALPDDERALLRLYVSMSPDGREALLAAARGLSEAYPGHADT